MKIEAREFIDNELTKEKFEPYLEDEKLVLEAELHAIAVISKAIAQKATNAAIDVLKKTIKSIIPAAL